MTIIRRMSVINGITLAAAFAAVSVFIQVEAQGILPAELVKYPDTIYVNAKIVTLDNHELNADPGSIVEAMAVRDEVIIALGSEQEVMRLVGPDTNVVNLGGRTMLPGIVESHVHPMGNSEAFAREIHGLRSTPTGYDLRIDAAATEDETMLKVARAMELLLANVVPDPDDWISIALEDTPESPSISTLIAPRRLSDVRISKADISEIIPDYPFILTSGNQIFGKTGYGMTPEQSASEPKAKNIWYHVTVDEHGEPVNIPVVEFNE